MRVGLYQLHEALTHSAYSSRAGLVMLTVVSGYFIHRQLDTELSHRNSAFLFEGIQTVVNVGCLRSCFAILSGRVADDALHFVVGSWGFEYASRFEVDSRREAHEPARPGSHWESSSGRAGAFASAQSRGFIQLAAAYPKAA